ncbi:MAG: NifU family protein [Candidatus Altiarchaeales archaeon]|nr:NifU family protein [Candidatus Altiarchaeales archaeon]
MCARVNDALAKVRPFLQADGGDVELVGIEGSVVKVRLKGMCFGCPMAQMTLSQGIERAIKKEVPQIERVEQVE